MGYSIRTNTYRYTRWVEWPSRKMLVEELYDYASEVSAVRKDAFHIFADVKLNANRIMPASPAPHLHSRIHKLNSQNA